MKRIRYPTWERLEIWEKEKRGKGKERKEELKKDKETRKTEKKKQEKVEFDGVGKKAASLN